MTNPDNAVTACVDLIGRAGASSLDFGYLDDQPPHRWYAHAQYRGTRITVEGHDSPEEAALALAQRILRNGTCRCGQTVALTDRQDGCRWQLVGARWEPGCDAPPIDIPAGGRGNLAAMGQALTAVTTNRATRRAANKRRSKP